ncbi:uncharacterized protein LOC128200930 [Galleria mellonella]|uniref:Uncharacterized protein LOC128200930 n=1 Tax=Galleria mellonella TaxID=7137 RepID=A0ABM3ML30_GALME|nr:uncharacterized protein LOC128200930 [Galleria mellonella]
MPARRAVTRNDIRLPLVHMYDTSEINTRLKLKHHPARAKLATASEARADIPLRAKSVCLVERPKSQYARNVRSADHNRFRSEKQFFRNRLPSSEKRVRPCDITVKKQNRKLIEKVPFNVSVQTLSIPMKYADNPKPRHSNSKPAQNLCNTKEIDVNKTKSPNPSKQVSDNKRLCQTVGCGKETENKLLLQISEAEQVSDFERILNCNTILSERSHGHVWRGCLAYKSSASVVPRPRSAYSLYAVSQAYEYLFHQHEESLQPLIDNYRQAHIEQKEVPPGSLLSNSWYENLQGLSEFYEDDQALQTEIETITDRIISEEVQTPKETKESSRNKNFNVNLAGLIGLHVNGESCTPTLNRDDFVSSPDIDRAPEDEKEWLIPSMSANSDDQNKDKDSELDCLAQNLNTVNIDSDGKVPTITFSNCCENRTRSDQPSNTDVVIHLTVPSVDSADEARPPMM